MISRTEAARFTALLTVLALAVGMLACGRAAPPTKTAPPTAAVALAPRPQPSLLGQLQGKWVGNPAGNEADRWEWTIQGSTVAARTSDGTTYKGTVRLDEQARPMRMDVYLTDSTDESVKGQTVRGIFKLEGNKVTMCFNTSDDSHPTEFAESLGLLLVGVKK